MNRYKFYFYFFSRYILILVDQNSTSMIKMKKYLRINYNNIQIEIFILIYNLFFSYTDMAIGQLKILIRRINMQINPTGPWDLAN